MYVGSAESEAMDQVLDSILLGPVRVGVSNFVLQVCFHSFTLSSLNFKTSYSHEHPSPIYCKRFVHPMFQNNTITTTTVGVVHMSDSDTAFEKNYIINLF